MGKSEKILAFSGITFAIICFLLCIFSVSIAETSIGFMYSNADNSACSFRGVSFGLATWLSVGGLSNIIVVTVAVVMLVCSIGCLEMSDDSACATVSGGISGGLGLCLMITYGIFSFAWFITGCVIIAEVPNDCRANFSQVWIMTIVSLVFRALGIISACCQRNVSAKNDE